MFSRRRPVGPHLRIAGSMAGRLAIRHPTGQLTHIFREHLKPADIASLRLRLPEEDHQKLQHFADGGEIDDGAPTQLRQDAGDDLVKPSPHEWQRASQDAIDSHRKSMVDIEARLKTEGMEHAPETPPEATTLETEAKQPKLFIQRLPQGGAPAPSTTPPVEQSSSPEQSAAPKLRIVHETPEVLLVRQSSGVHVPILKAHTKPEDLDFVRRMAGGGNVDDDSVPQAPEHGTPGPVWLKSPGGHLTPVEAGTEQEWKGLGFTDPTPAELYEMNHRGDPTGAPPLPSTVEIRDGGPSEFASPDHVGGEEFVRQDAARLAALRASPDAAAREREYDAGSVVPAANQPSGAAPAASAAPPVGDADPITVGAAVRPPRVGIDLRNDPWSAEIQRRTALWASAKEEQAALVQNQAKQEAEFRDKQLQDQQKWTNDFQTFLTGSEQAIQQRRDDIDRTVIDPNRQWHSLGPAGQVAAAGAILLSGLGAGIGRGGPNLALQTINRSIDQDIDAQRDDLGKKQTELGRLIAQTHDMVTARSLLRSQKLEEQAKALEVQAVRQYGDRVPIEAQASIQEMRQKATSERMNAASTWANLQATQNAATRANFEMARQATREPYDLANLAAQTRNANQEAALFPAKARQANAAADFAEARANNLGRTQKLVQSGGDLANVDPEDLTDKQRERVVQLPDGSQRLALTKQDAGALKQTVEAYNSIRSSIQAMATQRREQGRAWLPFTGEGASSQGLQNGVIEQLNQLFKLGRLTKADIELFKQQIPNVGDITDSDAGVYAKLQRLSELLDDKVNGSIYARLEGGRGSAPATASQLNFTPGVR